MRKSVIEEITFHRNSGELSFRHVRYILIRPETLLEMARALDGIAPGKAGEVFFQAGKKGGALSGKKFREALGLTPEEAFRFMAEMGGEIGWGRFEIETLSLEPGMFSLRVHNSPFGQASFPSPFPVCHLTRGVLAGLMEALTGKRMEVVEKECVAAGASSCLFVGTPESGLDAPGKPS